MRESESEMEGEKKLLRMFCERESDGDRERVHENDTAIFNSR